MAGSGIEDVFEEVYAANSIDQMLLGKSVERALRAHLMTESALMGLLIKYIQENNNIDTSLLEAYYKKAVDEQLDDSEVADMTNSDEYVKLQSLIKETKTSLKNKSRTSKLWVLYMDCIETVRIFLYAERTSNWNLHLGATRRMLNVSLQPQVTAIMLSVQGCTFSKWKTFLKSTRGCTLNSSTDSTL